MANGGGTVVEQSATDRETGGSKKAATGTVRKWQS